MYDLLLRKYHTRDAMDDRLRKQLDFALEIDGVSSKRIFERES